MTIKRVQQAAAKRGLYFDGEKRFRNTTVGCCYEINCGEYDKNGEYWPWIWAENLTDLYNIVKRF